MVQLLLLIIYLAFISLGLPDSLLGAAWPSIYPAFRVPLSYAGGLSMLISFGTTFSALFSERLIRRLGTGLLTALSVLLTAVAMLGYSYSHSYTALALLALPYGLGAGAVDAALNNYVALNYKSRHLSWLHCMWGVGAALSPLMMGSLLAAGAPWQAGYRRVALYQFALSSLYLLSLPLWKDKRDTLRNPVENQALGLAKTFRIPGAKAALLFFFSYCALEQSCGLWASSYLRLVKGLSESRAANYASLFFIGVTVGRAISGFITFKLNDRAMIRLGSIVILLGLAIFVLPLGEYAALAGLICIGLGCAPIFPSMVHATPDHFGKERSLAIVGAEMAAAYVGIMSMPPLFGWIAGSSRLWLLPLWLLLALAVMLLALRQLNRRLQR